MPDKKNLDKIIIRDLLLRCIIGINEEERREQQNVLINIVMLCNLSKACQTDNIQDTVDYKTIKKNILKLVSQSSFHLVEKLAQEIAALCLSYPGVLKAKVTVDKPGALRFARSVAVEIIREA